LENFYCRRDRVSHGIMYGISVIGSIDRPPMSFTRLAMRFSYQEGENLQLVACISRALFAFWAWKAGPRVGMRRLCLLIKK
jgi:hypothetical protein